MRKKLMVAGDSFSAPSEGYPGTSWAEVLAKKLDWEELPPPFEPDMSGINREFAHAERNLECQRNTYHLWYV